MNQKVFVTAITVARRVGVVLKQINRASNTFVVETILCIPDEFVENRITCTVVKNNIQDGIALWSCEFWVRTHIEIQPPAVLKKNVATSPPRDDASKQIASNFVWS
jgi:hypothetical protein